MSKSREELLQTQNFDTLKSKIVLPKSGAFRQVDYLKKILNHLAAFSSGFNIPVLRVTNDGLVTEELSRLIHQKEAEFYESDQSINKLTYNLLLQAQELMIKAGFENENRLFDSRRSFLENFSRSEVGDEFEAIFRFFLTKIYSEQINKPSKEFSFFIESQVNIYLKAFKFACLEAINGGSNSKIDVIFKAIQQEFNESFSEKTEEKPKKRFRILGFK